MRKKKQNLACENDRNSRLHLKFQHQNSMEKLEENSFTDIFAKEIERKFMSNLNNLNEDYI